MNTSPHSPVPSTHDDASRDSQGRFTHGNPGGPGNPYYRRQAELKRCLLQGVTGEDVSSVMRVLVSLARSGDLAAIKLFLEYTVGKPAKEVDPDKEELHEWSLQQQTPRLPQVLEAASHGIDPGRANQVTRELVRIVGDCHLSTLSKTIHQGTTSTNGNGSKRPTASARRMAAGVRSTVATEDNGDGAWNELFEVELCRAVPTEENGGLHERPPLGNPARDRHSDGSGPEMG